MGRWLLRKDLATTRSGGSSQRHGQCNHCKCGCLLIQTSTTHESPLYCRPSFARLSTAYNSTHHRRPIRSCAMIYAAEAQLQVAPNKKV